MNPGSWSGQIRTREPACRWQGLRQRLELRALRCREYGYSHPPNPPRIARLARHELPHDDSAAAEADPSPWKWILIVRFTAAFRQRQARFWRKHAMASITEAPSTGSGAASAYRRIWASSVTPADSSSSGDSPLA